jgi:hypothetical protein
MSIEVILGDKYSLTKNREDLSYFPYFKVLMEDNPSTMQFIIPNNPHLLEIYNLLNNTEPNIISLNIDQTFRYLRASAFLGRVDKKYTTHLMNIVKTDTDLLALLKHFPAMSEMRLTSLLADIAGKVLYHYKNNIPASLSNSHAVRLLLLLVPYMTHFKYAIGICLHYNIDCNLITAIPTIDEVFAYSKKNLSEICQIYEYNKTLLDRFLDYFDQREYQVHNDANGNIHIRNDKEHFTIPGTLRPEDLPNPFNDLEAVKRL